MNSKLYLHKDGFAARSTWENNDISAEAVIELCSDEAQRIWKWCWRSHLRPSEIFRAAISMAFKTSPETMTKL